MAVGLNTIFKVFFSLCQKLDEIESENESLRKCMSAMTKSMEDLQQRLQCYENTTKLGKSKRKGKIHVDVKVIQYLLIPHNYTENMDNIRVRRNTRFIILASTRVEQLAIQNYKEVVLVTLHVAQSSSSSR